MIVRMFLTLALVFAPFYALAQSNLPAGMVLIADCELAQIVSDYVYRDLGQIPFAGGPGIMQRDDREFAEGVWKIYANPDWSTYTIVIEFSDGVMCLVGMGEGLEPFEDPAR